VVSLRIVGFVGKDLRFAMCRMLSGTLIAYAVDSNNEIVAVCREVGDAEAIPEDTVEIMHTIFAGKVRIGDAVEALKHGGCVTRSVSSSAEKYLARPFMQVYGDAVIAGGIWIPLRLDSIRVGEVNSDRIRLAEIPLDPGKRITKAFLVARAVGSSTIIDLMKVIHSYDTDERDGSTPIIRVISLIIDRCHGVSIYETLTGARIAYIRAGTTELYLFRNAAPSEVMHVLLESSEVSPANLRSVAEDSDAVASLSELSRRCWVAVALTSPRLWIENTVIKLARVAQWRGHDRVLLVDEIYLYPPRRVAVTEVFGSGTLRIAEIPLDPRKPIMVERRSAVTAFVDRRTGLLDIARLAIPIIDSGESE